MATKNRIVTLMNYLREHSDESHPVSTAEIREAMDRAGCPVTTSTLRSDIESLRASGYRIRINEQSGMPTTYSWLSREWTFPELQILTDAVSSARFLTVKKSRELMDRLACMAGPAVREKLEPRILVSERVKAPNSHILANVQIIDDAIRSDRKITFRYMQYDANKCPVPRHEGTPEERYLISPYAMVWNSDWYYLAGYSEKRNKVITFRIDRMDRVRQVRQRRAAEPKDFSVQDYADKIFRMYDGKIQEVVLRCRNHLMDQVIDRFGPDVTIRKSGREYFEIVVTVAVSATFYSWLFQFTGEMVVISPGHVKDAYADMLEEALDDALT